MFLRENILEIVCIKPSFSRNSGENEIGAAQPKPKTTTTATVLVAISEPLVFLCRPTELVVGLLVFAVFVC